MIAEHRETYRKPTPEEARRFAAIDRAWRKMRRRQALRLAVQYAVAWILVGTAVGLIVAVIYWATIALIVGLGALASLIH